MKSKSAKPQFKMTVRMTDDRKAPHEFFTVKSARHYAKEICGNHNITKITLAGPDVSMTIFGAE